MTTREQLAAGRQTNLYKELNPTIPIYLSRELVSKSKSWRFEWQTLNKDSAFDGKKNLFAPMKYFSSQNVCMFPLALQNTSSKSLSVWSGVECKRETASRQSTEKSTNLHESRQCHRFWVSSPVWRTSDELWDNVPRTVHRYLQTQQSSDKLQDGVNLITNMLNVFMSAVPKQ